MNTVEMKVEAGREKGQLKSGKAPKPLFSKLSGTALTSEELELLRVTQEARDKWIETNANFDHVCDELLVDYYTYLLKACEARYTYFIKLVKEKGLSRYI